MSTLLARALEAEGIDLLLLGALADKLRRAERGDVVRIWLDAPRDEVRTFTRRELDDAGDAHTFLRKIAIARLAGEGALPLRVDAESLGLQLAQVALTFGADEVVVPIARVRLEVYSESSDAAEKAVLREREIAGLVRSAGRVPRMVERRGDELVERDPDSTTHAVRKFRAPGREVKAMREAAEKAVADNMEIGEAEE